MPRLRTLHLSADQRAALLTLRDRHPTPYPRERAAAVLQVADVLAAAAGTRVRPLRRPTCAPWTNPIEKVWRRLQQEVLHMHPFGDHWAAVKTAVTTWPDDWAGPSPGLLRYVGLDPG